METSSLHDVWIGVDISKNSRDIISSINDYLKNLFAYHKIEINIKENPHMTLGYFKDISQTELAHILKSIQEKKDEHKDTQLINLEQQFDHSFHKLKLWDSNVNNDLYIVLAPHNPESLFHNLIQNEHITPHISLAKVVGDKEVITNLLPYIKDYRDLLIQNKGISVDLSKIHISF